MSVDPSLVWIGIPVYNNAGTIVDIARRAREQMPHVVVVDDGSTDADLRDLLNPIDVSVVRHDCNRGKGAALMTAFRHAAERGGEYLIAVDGDGQHFPEDAAAFLPQLRPDTIVIGVRQLVEGVMPRSSRFGRRFSDLWMWAETGRRVRDTQCGFRAYPLDAILTLPLKTRHYNFEIEVLARAFWSGLRAVNTPVRVNYLPGRVSSFRLFLDNLRLTRLHIRLLLRRMFRLTR